MLMDSSPAALQRDESSASSSGLRSVGHEVIVTPGPGIRKCSIPVCDGVQFAERVRRVMHICQLTIRSAAKRWGYSERTIADWRAGRSEPRWSEWEAIERHELAEMKGTGT